MNEVYKFPVLCTDKYHKEEFRKTLQIEAESHEAAQEIAKEYIQKSNLVPNTWMKYELEVVNE